MAPFDISTKNSPCSLLSFPFSIKCMRFVSFGFPVIVFAVSLIAVVLLLLLCCVFGVGSSSSA